MDFDPCKDKGRKRRKSSQVSDSNIDRKNPEEEANHVLAVVEESMEKSAAEDSEQQRQLLLQRCEDPDKMPVQETAMSSEMDANIQEIRQRIDQFTQQVSGLLEAVKTFFAETSNAFEERLVLLHQAQIDKWEEEIKVLGMIDAENEDMNYRLGNAQELLNAI